MGLASRISQGFDAHVKKWRFLSCLYYEGSIFLEAITPLFHSQIMFLILASIANAGKNICWLSTSASKAHIHKYMCKRENLADITGKAVSQSIATNLMGTSIGMLISLMVTVSNTVNIMPIILTLSTCHILSIYASLNYIHDPLLNINRCHVLLREFMQNGDIRKLTKPDDMTKNEKLLGWKRLFGGVGVDDDGLKYKVNVNKRLDECIKTEEDIMGMMEFYERIGTKYWIMIRDGKKKRKISLWYKQEAENEDVLESMLVVGYLQFMEMGDGILSGVQGVEMLEDAIEFGRKNRKEWVDCLKESEWNVDNLFIELQSNRIEY